MNEDDLYDGIIGNLSNPSNTLEKVIRSNDSFVGKLNEIVEFPNEQHIEMETLLPLSSLNQNEFSIPPVSFPEEFDIPSNDI